MTDLLNLPRTGVLLAMTIHPVVWIAATAAFCLLAFFLFDRRRSLLKRRRSDREMSSVVDRFIEERSKSEAILHDLEIGIVAFSAAGAKLEHNPAAEKILAPEPIPGDLKTFVNRYGADNGIQAAILLGNESVGGQVTVGERVLRLRLKGSRFEGGRRAGTLVVLQDITEQEREERQRKEFVANVSHELKTPLTTIKTYSESLLEWGLAEKNADAIRKDIWRIHDDSLRMGRLVEDLLLLSSIDSRGMRLRLELLDLAQVVRQVVDRMQSPAREKEITLSNLALSRMPMVYVDRTATERILTNLVGNAIKYTDKGGTVKVYFGHIVDEVYLKVADNGCGIDADHLPRIFNRFYRVDMTGSRMYGGTGLGLAIARELVDLHDGKINVTSFLGKGTEFTVMLPTAEKVLRDTLEAYEVGQPKTDPLHAAAAEELDQAARALRIGDVRGGTLSKVQIDVVLAHILEHDGVDRVGLDDDTREFDALPDTPAIDENAPDRVAGTIRVSEPEVDLAAPGN